MVTKQQILDDFVQAFKEKNEVKKRTLEAVKSEILVVEKAKGNEEVTSEKIIDVLKSMAKKRKESIAAYDEGGRDELAEKEREELFVIESYLPEQMGEAQIKEIIEKIVIENKFTVKDFGQAMGIVMKELKGKADGALVSKILKEVLK